MKVPQTLDQFFGPTPSFQERIGAFALDKGLLPDSQALTSHRFLSRSVVPHVKALSSTFNRKEFEEQASGLDPYWKKTSNRANLRLAYFLCFMPANVFRLASVWAELSRLGYRFDGKGPFRGLELGSGPATGPCGIAAGEAHGPIGLPAEGNWALIEQDHEMLRLGVEWAEAFCSEVRPWTYRPFRRKIDFSQPLLPERAPRFHLWLSSFFLNETSLPEKEVADRLLESWERHLEEEGLVILVEPALREQSRRLLSLRSEILARRPPWLQVLLPCLGHQECQALAAKDDWCHEEVSWWRPPYFAEVDKLCGLDRKTLPFSYLVLARSGKPRERLLPALSKASSAERFRLVSPAHREGRDLEFFLCGECGKKRARYLPRTASEEELSRGSILLNAKIRGDSNASRIESVEEVLI